MNADKKEYAQAAVRLYFIQWELKKKNSFFF